MKIHKEIKDLIFYSVFLTVCLIVVLLTTPYLFMSFDKASLFIPMEYISSIFIALFGWCFLYSFINIKHTVLLNKSLTTMVLISMSTSLGTLFI